jgi:hypothetical protein
VPSGSGEEKEKYAGTKIIARSESIVTSRCTLHKKLTSLKSFNEKKVLLHSLKF